MHENPIDLYVFSGTGNTLLAACEVARYFCQQGIDIRLLRLEKADPAAIDPTRTLGLAFPVAVQSTYPFVWRFVEALPQVQGTGAFMLDTLAGYSGGLVGPMRKLLKSKGYTPMGACEIVMPANFMKVMKDEEKKRKRIAKGLKKARIFAHDLHYGLAKWREVPVLPNLMNRVSRSEKPWQSMRRKLALTIDTSRCIRCGLCYKLCPTDNIRMYEFPEMQDHCEICVRCINFCPVQAISTTLKSAPPYRAVKANDLLNPDPTGTTE
ncbi:MAG: EFR1 family ferrodoxin [Candidatus Cloacimonetes bacterium]|nr:EFR1 family ferrodoxin [Candidatus Cloacimonadota bacterium]